MRPQGSAQKLQARRLKAIALLDSGLSQSQAAQRLGVKTNSVWRWYHAFRKGGRDALVARPVTGRKSKLNSKQKEELAQKLLQGARAAGFATDLWTCPRIALLIRQSYGVRYHVDSLPKLLRALGFSCQKPQKQAAERDEELITQWVRKDWPRIKKRARD